MCAQIMAVGAIALQVSCAIPMHPVRRPASRLDVLQEDAVMPGYDEETIRNARQDKATDDPDRVARRMDRGPSPDAGATESIGIRPDAPVDEKPGRVDHGTVKERLPDR